MDGALQSDILAHEHPKNRIVSSQSLFSVIFLMAVFVLRPQLSDTTSGEAGLFQSNP